MKRFGWAVSMIVALSFFFGSGVRSVSAATYLYKSTNKLDFIKVDKAKKDEKDGGIKQPHVFEPDHMRAILGSIHFNKKALLMDGIGDRPLFDEGNVEFLTPYLVEAFQKAGPEEVVIVSYFTRESKVLIQNDRLTVFRAFLKDDGLHIKFTKLHAKLLGDRTTMGRERASSEARGLRVSLEVQPGQNRISHDPEELVFDLAHFTGAPQKPVPAMVRGTAKKEAVTAPEKSLRDRLKELDQLKKDELITQEEYEKKRRELLKDL